MSTLKRTLVPLGPSRALASRQSGAVFTLTRAAFPEAQAMPGEKIEKLRNAKKWWVAFCEPLTAEIEEYCLQRMQEGPDMENCVFSRLCVQCTRHGVCGVQVPQSCLL